MMLAIVSFLAGMVLGQRFNVLVLVPAIAVVLIIAIGIGAAHPDSAWSIVKMGALATTSVQIGYLGGMGIRVMTVAMHVGPRRRASLQASATPQRLGR